MDASRHVIDDGAIAVQNGSIVAVGTRAEIEAKYTAREMIDARGRAVVPGLINGHAHSYDVVSRTRGRSGFAGMVDKIHFPAEAKTLRKILCAQARGSASPK
jgi:cytosine/adenosine deaminase-related metal-dependent hydrolase